MHIFFLKSLIIYFELKRRKNCRDTKINDIFTKNYFSMVFFVEAYITDNALKKDQRTEIVQSTIQLEQINVNCFQP